MLSEKDYKLIEDFLGNQMSSKEVSVFENRLNKDENLKKEVQLFKLLNEHLAEKNLETYIPDNENTLKLKNYLESEEARLIKEKIKDTLETNKPIRYNHYWAAAILLIFISIASAYIWYQKPSSKNQLFNDFYSVDDISVNITRSSNSNWNLKISNAFKEKRYKESIDFFKNYTLQEVNIDTSLFLLKGASHLALEDTESAIKSFEILANSKLLDKSKGQWFLALSYIKNNNLNEAKLLLNNIKNDKEHYKNKEAEVLLKKLKNSY